MVYILLELAPFGSLFQFLDRKGTMPEFLALRFTREVGCALAHLHNRGLVHRDVKPENVLLDESFRVKLCDFGFCCNVTDGREHKSVCGTFEYLSPEVLDELTQTIQVDAWCLGVLLYELLHCRVPFFGLNPADLRLQMKTRTIQMREDLSPDCVELIKGLLTIEPTNRLTVEKALKSPVFLKIEEKFNEALNQEDFNYLMTQYYEHKLIENEKKAAELKKIEESSVSVKVVDVEGNMKIVKIAVPESVPAVENKLNMLAYVNLEEHRDVNRSNSMDKACDISKLCKKSNNFSYKFHNKNHYLAHFLVRMAIESRFAIHGSGRIILLERDLNWPFYIYKCERELKVEGEISFVIFFSDILNLFIIKVVRYENEKFVVRKLLKKEFRGKTKKQLEEYTGLHDFTFCHESGLIAGCGSLFSAILVTEMSL